jgi:hypothetical protein
MSCSGCQERTKLFNEAITAKFAGDNATYNAKLAEIAKSAKADLASVTRFVADIVNRATGKP